MVLIIYATMMTLLLFVKSADFFKLFRALNNITKDVGRSLFRPMAMSFIHQMVPLYFAQLMYVAYVDVVRIKWPCFLSRNSEDPNSTSEVLS